MTRPGLKVSTVSVAVAFVGAAEWRNRSQDNEKQAEGTCFNSLESEVQSHSEWDVKQSREVQTCWGEQ